MIENLIKKVVQDAEAKAGEIIGKAERRLQERYSVEKEKIDGQYQEKLRAEKEGIDREGERKISAFRMEKEQELLALQNALIEDVMQKTEAKFNAYLDENLKEIVAAVVGEMDEKDCTVSVPDSAGDFEIQGLKITRDSRLKNAFTVSSARWTVVFNWESIRSAAGDILRKEAAVIFNLENGKQGKDVQSP